MSVPLAASSRSRQTTQWLALLVISVPILRWVWLGMANGMGAHPQAFLISSSGLWTLVFLLLTLAIAPLGRIKTFAPLLSLRKTLGLTTFFYACLHLVAWALWECNGQFELMVKDVINRPFVALGMVAMVLLALMAATSSIAWRQRLAIWWYRLHRSIHVVAVLAIVHFWLVRSGKNDFFEPTLYALILLLLWSARWTRYFIQYIRKRKQ